VSILGWNIFRADILENAKDGKEINQFLCDIINVFCKRGKWHSRKHARWVEAIGENSKHCS
jgi:hypothetical protein